MIPKHIHLPRRGYSARLLALVARKVHKLATAKVWAYVGFEEEDGFNHSWLLFGGTHFRNKFINRHGGNRS